MEIAFSMEIILFLALIAIVAGFVDTLAGGGGLITVPALLVSGVPPLFALGTNKFQGCIGTATASYIMFKKRRVKWREVRGLMLAAFMGSVLGTIVVQFINTQFLSFLIPCVLVLIATYFIFSRQPIKERVQPKLSDGQYRGVIVPFIGAYDGLLGPGTGSFFAAAGVSLRGRGIIDATAEAKTLNFSTNIASLMVFIFAGNVMWSVGVMMIAGQILGAWLGSHCLLKINPAYLRYIVVIICVCMLIKYGISDI